MDVSHVLTFQSVKGAEICSLEGISSTEETAVNLATLESDIRKLQHQDSQLAPILQYLEHGTVPSEDKIARRLVLEVEMYEVSDGMLYYISPSAPNTWRLAVPQCLKQTLLKENHDGRFAGHFAERKIYATISRRYWWKSMRADVLRFCRSCLCVHLGKVLVGRHVHYFSLFLWVDLLGIDVLQLPLSHRGNQYAIVFQDYLTKWPEVFAAADQKAETIAHLLVEQIVSRHGVPTRQLSDRGPNFLSVLVQEVCKLLGATMQSKHIRLPPSM